MTPNFDELLGARFHRNAEGGTKKIAEVERGIGMRLPTDFRAFLEQINGGEGMIGKNYVMLWSAEDLAPYNEKYLVDERAPGLLLFGSDGGGEGFAFNTRSRPFPTTVVPLIGMELKYAIFIAPSFTDFLRRLLVPTPLI